MTTLEAAAAYITARIAALASIEEADALANEIEAHITSIKTARTSTAHGADDHAMVELLEETLNDTDEARTALQYEAYLGELEAERLGEQFA